MPRSMWRSAQGAAAGLACLLWTGVASSQVEDRLSNVEFHQLTTSLSEPSQEFLMPGALNVVSNERSFAQVVPQLEASTTPGGIYVGVGPEQNFTYIAAVKPRIAFIVDIQRSIFVEHLLYKAIFDLSADRKTFVEHLFSRRLGDLQPSAPASALMDAAARAQADDAMFERNVTTVVETLRRAYGVALASDDAASMRAMYKLFAAKGPAVNWSSTIGTTGEMAPYSHLMAQRDASGRELSFLADEVRYATVRSLEVRNLVVPIVGNFAGPKALRGLGAFLRSRNQEVSTFYVSNVEDYLGHAHLSNQPPPNGKWSDFCANVATWPLAADARFVRPYGVAELDGGAVYLDQDIASLNNKEVKTYSVAGMPPLPTALFPIAPEVQACR